MVESTNYSNSPLANPDFLSRVAPVPTSDPGFSPLAPGILERAVAAEPVYQAKTLEERKRELEIEEASLADRSAGEVIADTLLTGANAAQSGLTYVAGLGLKGIGAATEALAPDESTMDDIGSLISDRAMIQSTRQSEYVSGFLEQGKTETALRTAEIQGEMAQIDEQINQNQYEEDIANGDSEFIASLSLYGRQAFDFTDRTLSSPVATTELIGNAVGSLASGSFLSGIGSKIATSVAERFGMEGVKKLGLEYGGSALGMGVTEAASTYAGTVEEVMGRTPEQMLGSEMYRELTGLGMAHEQAQAQVADVAGLDAFVNQLPAAMAAGLLSAKFNANPLSVMRGENPLGVFITAGKEALEETAQGATGQYNQNSAIKDYVDPTQRLDAGVVDSAIGGLLGGFASSGIIGAPSGIVNGLQQQSDRIASEEEVRRNDRNSALAMGELIATQRRAEARAAMTPEERDAELRSVLGVTSPGQDLFNSVVKKGSDIADTVKGAVAGVTGSDTLAGAVETIKTGVQTVKAAAVPAVSQVIKAGQDYLEQGSPVVQNETVAAAESVVAAVLDPAIETGTLGTPDTTVTKESLPEIFQDSVPESASLAETMTNIVKTIAEKKVPISSMTDDAILFVTQKFNEMQNAASTLAPDVQKNIKKVLASPDLERIRKRAARMDLNTLISPAVEKISSKVKAMTVAMSKINPTNVNPDVVDKILKQEDRGDLTPEDVQDMEIAATVSRPMNQLIKNIVKIEDDKNAFLVSTGQEPSKEENSFEAVSRRLVEGGKGDQEKLPSVKKSVNQIIIGMRSPDKSVDVDGVRVPVADIISNFKNLIKHMTNKVDALNVAFDQNDEKGVGPTVNFEALSSKTGKFIPVGMAGSGNAVYNKRSIKSVTFAKTVGADAAMLVEVHNALAKAYPDQFPDGLLEIPVIKTVENQNTTAVEEISAEPIIDENAQTIQEVTPDQTPPTTAVEDATPVASETPSETIVLGLTQEKADAMTDEELLVSVNSWEPTVQSTPMEQGRVLSIMAVMDPLITPLELPDNIIRLLAWLKSDSPSHKGQAYWAERVISLSPSTVRKILSNEEEGGIHVFFHELFHVIDAKASKKFGRTASMDHFDFDVAEGEIFDEVKKLTDSDPEMKEYFSYALSYDTENRIASELFAEIGAMMMLMDREEARKLLPKGVAYVERIIEQAGGAKAPTNGDPTPVTDEAPPSDDQAQTPTEITTETPTEVSVVSKRFVSVFYPKKKGPKTKTADEILAQITEKEGTETYVEFATILKGRISAAMNNRVTTLKRLESNTKTLAQGLKENQDAVLEIRDFKPMMLVDPETSRYNQGLLDLASMVVIDWMTTARAYGAERMDDMLEELGLSWDTVADDQVQLLINSVPTRSTSEGLARKVIKIWNVQVNKEAQMVDIRGTTEGLVKEIFTVLSQMEDPLVRIVEVKTGEGRSAAYELSNLKGEQEAIGLNAAGSLDKVLFPEEQIMASFGEKLAYVPKSQNNKSDVPLTAMEQKAIKKMQDTAHTEALPVVDFFTALGLDTWAMMAGKKDSSQLVKRHPLRLTIEGKNTSIERDFETAFQMVNAAAGRPVYYPVGVTNVGRHQMKGINPQNNKLLRAMITPTHSKLNMANSQRDKDGFWLTVAQSSGVVKVEKKFHKEILSTIQADFAAKFGEATGIALAYLETGTLDQQGFAAAMLKATKGEEVSVAQVNAVLAVARLQQAQKAGTLESFETSLSFELDGKTDGPSNMMVAFGQGLMTRAEYMNFKRVGLFLGSKTETLNSFLSTEQDLYEVNSVFSTRRMVEYTNSLSGMDKQRMLALQRFAAHFGDFEIKPDGTIVMTRGTSKNPLTKKVYGSGVKGIAEGISQDMLVEFYTRLVALPDGVTVENHLNYQEINDDLKLLFGVKLPDTLEPTKFILPNASMKPFAEFVQETIGTILSESIDEVMSTKTMGVNDLLVFSTGVQGEFMKLFFEQRLAEAMAELNEEFGEGENQKGGKPTLRKMSQATYDAIVKETLAFAPYFQDGLQNLRVGDFTGEQDKTEMSSNLNGNIRSKSTMQKPDNIGVKAIPYLIQGRGDAMMMNRIFGADNAPERAIPIFDGIDMAIADFMGLADQINEAVLANWDHDVLESVVTNFDQFLEKVEKQELGAKLDKAFWIVKKNSEKKSTVTAMDPGNLAGQLFDAQQMNLARKTVFKSIPVAVDHMGGSGQAHIRNYEAEDLSFEEINERIQMVLDGVPLPTTLSLPAPVVDPFEDVEDAEIVEESNLVVTDVATVVEALMKETKPYLRDVIRSIRGMMPDDARIVMGTEEEIAQWRKENLGQNQSKKLDQRTKGFYDVDNNIIFIMSENPETIVHEMIHMATFQAVLDHYQGTKKSTAVKNLEVLMQEFLDLDTSTMVKEALEVYADAKRAIVKAQAEATPMGDSVALNEFMAWSLSNDHLMRELKVTPSSLVFRLTKVAKAWIQKILGMVPLDMYAQILFNTEMIRNEEFPGGFDNGNAPPNTPPPNSGVTPPADAFTNFWIDLLRAKLADAQNVAGLNPIDLTKKRVIQQKLGAYTDQARDALVKLDFGGFGLSEYQKKTYIAIHTVLAVELRLDSNALIALGKVYEHVANNLTPAMFGTGQAAQDRYSTVMELMGATKNDEGMSDTVAVLLALSQTSDAFRNAMDQIPQPAGTPGIQTTSLNDMLSSTTGFLMQKLIASTDTEGKGVKAILDSLSDQILRQDDANEYKALKGLMGSFDKADSFINGALSKLAQKSQSLNQKLKASNASKPVKIAAGSILLATQFVDVDSSALAAKGIKDTTHMGGILDNAVFIREMVAEIVGADEINSDVIQMLDNVTYAVQSGRQAFREELPVLLQNEFQNHPTASQWKDLFMVLAKGDFAALFDLTNPDDSFDMLSDQGLLDRRIKAAEKKITTAFPGQDGLNILIKAQQLADFMNDKGAGFQLFRNAYAIHKLAVGAGNKPALVADIDRLVSLYALNGTDMAQRDSVAQMQASDPDGVHTVLVYMQALNKEEDQKIITEAAKTNGYKGYIPNHSKGEISLIIAKDTDREDLERRGYTRVADDTTDSNSLISRGYYMSTVKQSGNYSQGVLQQIQDTYRGVNSTSGLTVNGTVSGVISGVAVISITNAMNNSMSVTDPKNVLLPVYDDLGSVLYYERGINPDLAAQYLQPESNLALMIGSWAGRQVEEKFSHQYNKALVAKLKKIWDDREANTEDLFIRMDTETKDKIYAESWNVIPPQLKEHIINDVFGEEDGFMVRKDMINLALGYRDPSITDVWSGNHRLGKPVELAIKVAAKATMGDKAYTWLANTESFTQATVSTAKDLIVVRSLVVPLMNTQSNVFQLVNRGVGTKKVMDGYKAKFVEIDKLNANLKKIMGLQARVRLKSNDPNQVAILKQQIQVLEDENNRFSVSPLVKEGAYKNISEGITELDASITDGKFGDWVESQINKLPSGVQTVAKYGLLSKDTALYKGANKAVQYGDFVAKSIYYDFLTEKGLSHKDAMKKVNEEFINFSLLPGRMRTGLEAVGATWFLTFKIRSVKTGLQMMRDNPVRSLAAVGVFGLESGPITDNVVGKFLEGTLPYSLGWDMLFDAPGMNPWIELMNG
jgi:hypothetical protein